MYIKVRSVVALFCATSECYKQTVTYTGPHSRESKRNVSSHAPLHVQSMLVPYPGPPDIPSHTFPMGLRGPTSTRKGNRWRNIPRRDERKQSIPC